MSALEAELKEAREKLTLAQVRSFFRALDLFSHLLSPLRREVWGGLFSQLL